MRRANSLEKPLILGKIEGRRRRAWQRMRWLDGITDSMDMSSSMLRETVKDREAWCSAVRGAVMNQTWLSDWITATTKLFYSTLQYLIFPLILVAATLYKWIHTFLVLLNIYCLRLHEGWEIHKLHSQFASSFYLIGELNTAITLAHTVYEKCGGSCQNPGLPDCLGKRDHSSTWGDQSQYPCWADIWPEP